MYHVTFIQDLPKNRPQQSLIELYLPLKTSDLVLVEYRKWLDKYGSLLPFYQGYETSHNIDKQSVGIGTRFSRHTEICDSCSQAYQVTKRVKQTLVGVAIALAAVGLVFGSFLDTSSGSICFGFSSTFGCCSREGKNQV